MGTHRTNIVFLVFFGMFWLIIILGGYGSTEAGCRGGSRYVEGGFKMLTKKAIN